ncbi:Protein kinase, putative [Hondaea fermentalgiana]|uniref:Protein kinase, putative n=1 Tax=Hondaea fermentalgiana TaxID=2315210 RepID=A0A2R5GMX2_9STRA|nr:Protein kinase, putative [Hondaea fermentalgiana]|eukprot:GBG29214.1 Protein kinase, putative [Hondaea fermentalgiana]
MQREGKTRDEDDQVAGLSASFRKHACVDTVDDDVEASAESKDDLEGQWRQIDIREVEVGEQIGGGGFAIVYEGFWKGKQVALKTLFDPRADAAVKKEFMDELFVMSKLKHPNIVEMFGACTRAPRFCMVLELCESSLFHILHNSREELREKQLLGMQIELASAMEYLHAQVPAVIHRDIKSHNVLVSEGYHVKLCDFGLVSTSVTAAGTPAYMAPELLQSGLFSRKVDVYAFAVLMWEMYTRAIPFASWEPSDVRKFVAEGKRLGLPHSGYPKQCGQLIERCWASEPDRRPEFKNITRALTRIYSTIRDVSHLDEVSGGGDGDAFDLLERNVSKK